MDRAPLSLVAWIGVACAAFALAPRPPELPPPSSDERVALQRRVDLVVERARDWQRDHGDLTIPWGDAQGRLAIVIDDVGRDIHLFEQMLALRFRLTYSVLPGAIYAPGAQLRLRADPRRPREIMLHLPMEPTDVAQMSAGVEAREEFLRSGDGPTELRDKLERALVRVPAAVGVNNHMGSKLTEDRAAMDAIMPVLRARGLFFLDSRTTAATVAGQAATAAGVIAASRKVFLDDDPRREAIAGALARAVELATTSGEPVVVIGHPSPEVADVLGTELPVLHRRGVGVYSLSEVLARSGG